MRRHPAYRVRRLIAQEQRQLAADIEGRRRVDLELFMGGPMRVPESEDVRQHRMDLEACAITRGEPWWLRTPVAQVLGGFAVGASVAIVVVVACVVAAFVSGVFGDVFAGWFL